jgi:nucleoside phosphorylase
MICYAFPLEHEAEPLLKLCTQKETFFIGRLRCTLANFRDRQILVALIGLGRERAGEQTETIFHFFRPKIFVLAGYGGALIPALKIGHIMVSNNYSSKEAVSYLRGLSDFDFGVFYTSDVIVGTPAERDRAARTGKAQVIEMETANVADLVHDSNSIFIALRVISDDYASVLPVQALAAGFDPVRGRPTPLRLLAHLATHWSDVRPFSHFVSNLSLARRSLTSFLRQLNDDLPR